MITQLDERRGVPSASTMQRLHSCPPSHTMCAMLPAEEENDDAAAGTRIHAVLAGLADYSTLSAAEAETCDMCFDQAQRLSIEWLGSHEESAAHRHVEQRLGLTALGKVIEVTPESRANFVFTGQADLVLVDEGRALVIDFKTGRGETAEAVDNAQLASLAVLVCFRYNVWNVRVAIVQPWAGKPTVADYDRSGIEKADLWLSNALITAEKATPEDAKAGDWCKYCRAKAHCAAYRDTALQVVEVIEPMSIAGCDDETQRKAMFARAMDLRPEALAATMRGLGMVKRFVAAIEGAARARAAEDPEFQRFYKLREKNGRRSISDVGRVFAACSARGVTPEQFTALCSIGLGDVKDLLKKATGEKGKTLDASHDAVLAGAVEVGKASFELVTVNQLGGEE